MNPNPEQDAARSAAVTAEASKLLNNKYAREEWLRSHPNIVDAVLQDKLLLQAIAQKKTNEKKDDPVMKEKRELAKREREKEIAAPHTRFLEEYYEMRQYASDRSLRDMNGGCFDNVAPLAILGTPVAQLKDILKKEQRNLMILGGETLQSCYNVLKIYERLRTEHQRTHRNLNQWKEQWQNYRDEIDGLYGDSHYNHLLPLLRLFDMYPRLFFCGRTMHWLAERRQQFEEKLGDSPDEAAFWRSNGKLRQVTYSIGDFKRTRYSLNPENGQPLTNPAGQFFPTTTVEKYPSYPRLPTAPPIDSFDVFSSIHGEEVMEAHNQPEAFINETSLGFPIPHNPDILGFDDEVPPLAPELPANTNQFLPTEEFQSNTEQHAPARNSIFGTARNLIWGGR